MRAPSKSRRRPA